MRLAHHYVEARAVWSGGVGLYGRPMGWEKCPRAYESLTSRFTIPFVILRALCHPEQREGSPRPT